MDYNEQLLTKEWKLKRDEIINRDKKCVKCGSKRYLQVHHVKYIYGKFAWEYDNNMLVTLCDKCHEKEHGIEYKIALFVSNSEGNTAIHRIDTKALKEMIRLSPLKAIKLIEQLEAKSDSIVKVVKKKYKKRR